MTQKSAMKQVRSRPLVPVRELNGGKRSKPVAEPTADPRPLSAAAVAGKSPDVSTMKGSASTSAVNGDNRHHLPRRRHPARRQKATIEQNEDQNCTPQNNLPHEKAPPPAKDSANSKASSQSLEKKKPSTECSQNQSMGKCRSSAGGGMSHSPGEPSHRFPSHSLVLQPKHVVSRDEENGYPEKMSSTTVERLSNDFSCLVSSLHVCDAEKEVPLEEFTYTNNLKEKEEEEAVGVGTENLSSHPNQKKDGHILTNELKLMDMATPKKKCSNVEMPSPFSCKTDQQKQHQKPKDRDDDENIGGSHQKQQVISSDSCSQALAKEWEVFRKPSVLVSTLVESRGNNLSMDKSTSAEKEKSDGDVSSSCGIRLLSSETPFIARNCDVMHEVNGGFVPFLCKSPMHHHRSYSFTPEVSLTLGQLVDEHVVAYLIHTVESMMLRRQNQLRCISEYLTEAIAHAASNKGVQYGSLRYYVFGSVATCTVLPDGDNDMTVDVEGLLAPTRVFERGEIVNDVHSRTCMNKNGNTTTTTTTTTNNNSDNDVSSSQAATIAGGELLSDVADYLREHNSHVYVDAVVVAEVRVLKLVMDGSCYDITVGQLGGVECIRFLNEFDMLIGCEHLLKRTLLLLKAWCCYEAHILGGQGGYISSFAATTMLIAMMNTVEFLEDVNSEEDDQVSHGKLESFKNISPLQLFARFLKFFSYFDFEHYCVTVFGPLPCVFLNGKSLDLTKLEPSAEGKKHYDEEMTKSPGPESKEKNFEHSIDVSILGLTAEGQAELGHCIRRRAKPLITVSRVKRILHEEEARREYNRTASVESQKKGRRMNSGSTTMENMTEDVVEQALTHSHSREDDDGGVVDDNALLCPTCDTSHFPLRTMNVMDPLRWSASLCRGVSRNHLQRIRRAFREGLELFRKGSILLGDTCPSSPAVNGEHIDVAGVDSSSSFCKSSKTPSSTPNFIVDQRNHIDSVRKSVLEDIFGHTMVKLRRSCPDHVGLPSPPPPPRQHLQYAQCQRCLHPSFFCVSNLSKIYGPQFVFDHPESPLESVDELDGCSWKTSEIMVESNFPPFNPVFLNHQQKPVHQGQQQREREQQQQVNMMMGSVPMGLGHGPRQMVIPIPSTSQADALRFVNSLRGANWQDPSNTINNRDSSMNLMAIPYHHARGAPLVRSGAKSNAVMRYPRETSVGVRPNGNIYPVEYGTSQCYMNFTGPGNPGINCRAAAERNASEEASKNFLPPPSQIPQPLLPSQLLLSPCIDTRLQTSSTTSQNAQNSTRWGIPSHSYQ